MGTIGDDFFRGALGTMRTATNAAAASAINDVTLHDGELIYVSTFRDFFVLLKASTATPNGKTVLSTLSGTGRWERLNIPHQSWLRQPTWFIDPAAGNDENTGIDSGHAIQTDAERQRRWGATTRLSIAIVLTYMGDLPSTDPLNADIMLLEGGGLQMVGTPTIVRSGTLSAVTALNRATQQPVVVTDGAVSWASNVQQQVYIPSGARAGTKAFVAVGGATGRLSNPVISNATGETGRAPTVITPVVADPYQVRSLSKAYVGFFRITGGYGGYPLATGFSMADLWMLGTFGLKGAFTTQLVFGTASGCRFDSMRILGDRNFYYNGCHYDSCTVGGALIFAGLGMNYTTLDQRTPAACFFDFDFMLQGAPIYAYGNATLYIGNACAFDSSDGLLLADASVALLRGAFQGGTNFWGTNNSGRGINAGALCRVTASSAPTCNLGLGAARESKIGATDKLYSAWPYVDTTTQAMAVIA